MLSLPHSWLITWFVTRLTQWVPLVERNCLSFRSTRVHRFWQGSCYSIFSFICMFFRSLFVLLYFFFWPLCCLFFFYIQILITPLVSSNSSYTLVQWLAVVRNNYHSSSFTQTYIQRRTDVRNNYCNLYLLNVMDLLKSDVNCQFYLYYRTHIIPIAAEPMLYPQPQNPRYTHCRRTHVIPIATEPVIPNGHQYVQFVVITIPSFPR